MTEDMAANWLDAWGSIIGALAALGALGLAARQLKGLVRQLKQANFMSVITLEIEITNRKVKVDEACREVRLLALNNAQPEQILIANGYFESCVENWLNLFDRLAFCILKKYLKESDFKSEYRRYLSKLVQNHSQYLQSGTDYDNIIALCDRWQITIPKN